VKRRHKVRQTANFERNLASIREFLGPEGRARFDTFEELMAGRVVPLLEAQPGVGRPFLQRAFGERAMPRLDTLRARLGARELREYVVDDFLVLYVVSPRTVDLLAVKDQRQRSYTLGR
jgi:hypothetical protein